MSPTHFCLGSSSSGKRPTRMSQRLALSLVFFLASPLQTSASPVYHCGKVDQSKLQPFCAGVPPSRVCMDATDFGNIYLRNETTFDAQEQECNSAFKKHKQCPNDPKSCKPLNKTQYCGGANQPCNETKQCLPICWSDCYPCNSESDCELLVSFGVLAAEGEPCHFQA